MRVQRIKQIVAEFEKKINAATTVSYSDKVAPEITSEGFQLEAQEELDSISQHKGKKILTGVPASPGIVIGTIRNIGKENLNLLSEMQRGEIIVSEELVRDESDPYFDIALAFITDFEKYNSDIGAIARFLKKPAVVLTSKYDSYATEILKTGQKVVVDGNQGAVYLYH